MASKAGDMRAVIQRAARASVTLKETGERREIGAGLVVLLGIGQEDTEEQTEWLAEKIVGLRIFEDEAGKMNLSLSDLPGAEMLIVSQFTLYGNARKGRRPSFTAAAPPQIALPLYEQFIKAVQTRGIGVQTGEFGADMRVEIANDGPVTLIVETPDKVHTTA
jgi:D-tyrosyl-tRNA(Tyr) deacylase